MPRDNNLLARLKNLKVTPLREESVNANNLELNTNILKLLGKLDDEKIIIQVTNRASKEEFKDEIKDAFVKNHGAEKGLIKIENFRGTTAGANRNSHFIIDYEKKKWHAKSALHGKDYSLETPFNEFAHYKLNEHLGIGPRCYGFVSKDGVVMILTEDLNYRSLNGGMNKVVSFSDNVNKKEKLESIPNREQDNVHLCKAQIAIILSSLFDIKDNPGNSGFKSSRVNDAEIKEKLFIVDFTLFLNVRLSDLSDQKPVDMKTYAESLARILKPSSEPSSEKPLSEPSSKQPENQTIPKNIFKYKESPEVIGAALKKLFLDDDGEIKKFETDIKKSFEEARELLESYKIEDKNINKTEDPKTEDPKTGDTETVNEDFKDPHLKALKKQENKLLESLNTFLENEAIRTFLKEAGPKHKEEQIEKKKLKEAKLERKTPDTDLSPADNSHTQLSETQQPGPSLH